MSISSNIRKILFISAWCLAGTGLVLLLLAASRTRSERICIGYNITINGEGSGQYFVDSLDIVKVLTENNSVSLKNKSIKSFDLNKMEYRLRNEVWIRDAELFFDNKGILRVNVAERNPIARIFSSTGNSFYIDSSEHRLPLSLKFSAKLPVFTGFPSDAKKWTSTKDRQLIKQIKGMSMYIAAHPF
ncbi:MAG: hypothetical protein ABI415_07875, partial [Flavitalea sp.]